MDKINLNILRALQAFPELTVAQLAEKIGLSPTPCWRRLKQLKEAGVITGRAIILDPKKLGLSVDVIAHLRLSKHDEETLEKLEQQVKTHPEIMECFSMSGESDYMLR